MKFSKRIVSICLAFILSLTVFSGAIINASAFSGDIEYYESIPEIVYAITGEPVSIYYKNIISRPDMTVMFSASENVKIKCFSNKVELMVFKPGDYVITWRVYDNKFQLFDSGEMNFVARNENLKDMKVLVIGDSTVNAGTMTQAMLELFKSDGSTLTLLGTRGSGKNLHEGRGGWRSYDYCESKVRSNISNPFYKNGFDFTYYMNSQGYKDVDVVVLQLGINDINKMSFQNYSNEKSFKAFDSIISSIKNYNDKISIVISLTIPPNENVAVFEGKTTYSSPEEYRTNTIRFAGELFERYKNTENVYFSANNCSINTATEIRDVVHPTTQGYKKMAQTYIETLNFIINKDAGSGNESVVEAPVLTSATNNAKGVKVVWDEVKDAKSYIVYRKNADSSWSKVGVSSTTNFVDSKVTTGKKYTYTVKAKLNSGAIAFDEKGVSVNFIATPVPTVANKSNGVQVKWDKVSGAKGYYVYRKSSKNDKWKRLANVTTNTYVDKSVKSGSTYYYTVKAYNGSNTSSYISSGVVTKYLSTPKLTKITSGKAGVTLNYSAVTGAKEYYIYRKTAGASWKKIAVVSNGNTYYLDKSAVKGTKYTYTVRAVNGKYLSYYDTKGLTITDKY